MSMEYLGIALPEDVASLLAEIPEDRAVGLIRASEFIVESELVGVSDDSSDEELRDVFRQVKDSVSDLSGWPLSTIKGVSFYQMGGESYGDSPYEDFDLHLIAAELLAAEGKL